MDAREASDFISAESKNLIAASLLERPYSDEVSGGMDMKHIGAISGGVTAALSASFLTLHQGVLVGASMGAIIGALVGFLVGAVVNRGRG